MTTTSSRPWRIASASSLLLTAGLAVAVAPPAGAAVPTNTSVSINGGAAASPSPDVTLTLFATGATEMRLSNDNVTFTAYRPYTASQAWSLPNADGNQTVYVQYRDAAGDESPVVSDTIAVDTVVPTGTVSINGGAESTTSPEVTLTLSGADAAPATGVKEMRLSNDGVTYTAYRPYAATQAWSLSNSDGIKTVYVQFRDGAGNESTVATDTIDLEPIAVMGPHSVKKSPKDGATEVRRDVKVKITASEALDRSTLSNKSVYLKKKGSAKKVAAKIRYSSSKNRIVLIPKAPLAPQATYKVVVSTSVTDLAGASWDEKVKAGDQRLKFVFRTRTSFAD